MKIQLILFTTLNIFITVSAQSGFVYVVSNENGKLRWEYLVNLNFTNCMQVKKAELDYGDANSDLTSIYTLYTFPILQKIVLHIANFKQINFSKIHENLKILTIEESSIKVLPNNSISGLLSLEEFELIKSKLMIIEENTFNNLRRLKILKIHQHVMENIPFETFKGLINLEKIAIENGKLKDFDFDVLKNSPNLTEISLIGNQIDNVTDFLSIETWELFITDNRLTVISIFAEMKTLLAGSNRIAEEICQNKRRFEMEVLNLSDNMLQSIPCIEKMRKLHSLNVSCNSITHIPTTAFRNNEKMKNLYIQGNKLIDLDLHFFLDIPSFTIFIDELTVYKSFQNQFENLTDFNVKNCNTNCKVYEQVFTNSWISQISKNRKITCHCGLKNIKNFKASSIYFYEK